MPLRTWTFLKTCSDICGLCPCAVWAVAEATFSRNTISVTITLTKLCLISRLPGRHLFWRFIPLRHISIDAEVKHGPATARSITEARRSRILFLFGFGEAGGMKSLARGHPRLRFHQTVETASVGLVRLVPVHSCGRERLE